MKIYSNISERIAALKASRLSRELSSAHRHHLLPRAELRQLVADMID